MNLDIAVDALHATGWTDLDSSGCVYLPDGRAYPTIDRVKREFDVAGQELVVRYSPLFECYRAQWRTVGGSAGGAVVGASEAEAAVYALAQLRRGMVEVG